MCILKTYSAIGESVLSTEPTHIVPRERFELSRPCDQGILSPSCLPFHHRGVFFFIFPPLLGEGQGGVECKNTNPHLTISIFSSSPKYLSQLSPRLFQVPLLATHAGKTH